ncbi:Ig-like domain-containing protein [Loktanella sp. S4079]|uniref:Ig-like domain-containing protein n=1 Tax=Loktanella sp. S4079 TaxID=579483 RepID=UPI000A55F664|nr:Ig-like domain-containing protein [Loktanella sp. S4079]
MDNHSPAADLVSMSGATHVAISNGSWFDPDTWRDREVPGADAKVFIPTGVDVSYDGMSEESIFSVGVMGELHFATQSDTKLVVDTMVVGYTGKLTIGTADAPVAEGVNADIVFANNGAIDVNWDPSLLSRGLVALGEIEVHGQEKSAHHKALTDPMAGDTTITLAEVPTNWQVGDTIVIAGSRYDGHKWDQDIRAVRYHESEDEVRTITAIDGDTITFDVALEHDHDSPRADLKISVANYSRNVTFSSEEGAAVSERGHVMLHSRESDIRYAAFEELGRTDKSIEAKAVSVFGDDIQSDSNVQGRYSLHFHSNGVDDADNPAMAVGNAVFGSPGWGLVHHNSNVLVHNNATFDTFGAGFVAETGNEIGTWTNNIAINAEGVAFTNPKNTVDLDLFDMGRTGDGFWFQGRLVHAEGNVAASVTHGYTYFHRGPRTDDPSVRGNINLENGQFELADALDGKGSITIDDAPILTFHNNETFASHQGLIVVKANPNQGHDIHSEFSEFTAWSVQVGAELEYTAHYVLTDFDLIGKEPTAFSNALNGIQIGNNASDIVITNATIDGFNRAGIDLSHHWTNDELTLDMKQFFIVNPEFKNLGDDAEEIAGYLPEFDTLIEGQVITPVPVSIALDEALVYNGAHDVPGGRTVQIRGTKTDSLGQTPIPAGDDSYNLGLSQVVHILETDGYYSTADGQNVFFVQQYYSDRLTGEIYKFSTPVFIDDNVQLGNEFFNYRDAVYRGEVDLNNAAPVTADETVTVEGNQDSILNLLANDADPEGNDVVIDGITPPKHGQIFDNGDGTITYRPTQDYTGTETVKYWVTDGAGNVSEARLTITTTAAAAVSPTPGGAPGTTTDSVPEMQSLDGLADPTIAYGLGGLSDWSTGMVFLDIMKSSRGLVGHTDQWGAFSNEQMSEAGYLDENGWPTEIPEEIDSIGTIWAWSNTSENEGVRATRAGTYVLEYEGEGEFRLGGDVEIISQEGNKITFEAGGNTIFLNISETDPNGTGDHLRNFTMIKEEHLDLHEAGAIFNPDWLDVIEDTRAIRFMDWMGTNNSTISEWSERGMIDNQTWTGGQPPVEVMVELANQIGADPWFTMPHLATEEYMREFATYVRDNLDEGLKVTVEYTNEGWNWAFQQTQELLAMAKEEFGEELGRNVNSYYAYKATQMALIWKEVFGDEAETRLTTALGVQTGNEFTLRSILNAQTWEQADPENYQRPADVFDAIAATSYFGSSIMSDEENRNALAAAIADPNVDANAWLTAMLRDPEYSGSVPSKIEQLKSLKNIIAEDGLELILYEGGQHVHHLFAIDDSAADFETFLAEYVRSQDMADLYQDLWDGWMEVGDGPNMQFGDVGASSKYGSWSLRTWIGDTNPRAELIDELNETTPNWWGGRSGEAFQQGKILTGDNLNNSLGGTKAEDFLIGLDGDDVLYGFDDDDGLNGGDGDDILCGGTGNDRIVGGEGNDIAIFEGNLADYSYAADGETLIVTHLSTGDIDRLIDVETLSFADIELDVSSGTITPIEPTPDPIMVDGPAALRDAIEQTDGGETIIAANSDADYVVDLAQATGASGVATLTDKEPLDPTSSEDLTVVFAGSNGHDQLAGADGADVIVGGKGIDRMFGGDGADIFVFSQGTELDIVYDFTDGVDQIRLDGMDFGDVTITEYRGTGALLETDSDRMILRDVDHESLTIDDFIVAADPLTF